MLNSQFSIVSAVRWLSFLAIMKVCLQLLQVVILARLLTPEDYGLMAIAGVSIGVASLVTDCGLSAAFIQRRDISEEERSSLFWLAIGLGTVATLGLFFAAPIIAVLLGDERLTPVLQACAAIPLLMSSVQHLKATAEKNFEFRVLAWVETGGLLSGFFSMLWLGLNGYGVFALVIGALVVAGTELVFAWGLLAKGWRPQAIFSAGLVLPFLRFGLATTGGNLVNQLTLCTDLLLGGRLLSSAQLGLYSVPRGLLLQLYYVLNPIVTRIALPALASAQGSISGLASTYLLAVRATALICAPLYVASALFANEMVWLLLGEGWTGAAPYFQCLALWGFMRATTNPMVALFAGTGNPRLGLAWSIATFIITVPTLWLSAEFGPIGLAGGMVLISVGAYFPNWYWVVYPVTGISLSQHARAVFSPLLWAGVWMLLAACIGEHLFDHAAMRLFVMGLLGFSGYVMTAYHCEPALFKGVLLFLNLGSAAKK